MTTATAVRTAAASKDTSEAPSIAVGSSSVVVVVKSSVLWGSIALVVVVEVSSPTTTLISLVDRKAEIIRKESLMKLSKKYITRATVLAN
jgi:hypothetical protein